MSMNMFDNLGFDMSFGPFGSVSGDDTVIPIAVMGAIGLGALGFGISKAVNDSKEKKKTIEATNQLMQLADKALQQQIDQEQPVVQQQTQEAQPQPVVTQEDEDDQERDEFINDLKNEIMKELKGSVISELKGSLVKELQGTLVKEMQKEMQNIGKTISAAQKQQATQKPQQPVQKQPVVQQKPVVQQPVAQPQPTVAQSQPQPVQQPQTQQVVQPQQPQQQKPAATINNIPFLNHPYGAYNMPYGYGFQGPMYR